MTENDLTTTEILSDPNKNLCNLFVSNNDNRNDEDYDPMTLQGNLYYTETEFIEFLDTGNYHKEHNLIIVSLNIANLISKLSSLRQLLSNLGENKPDVIIVVETHISDLNDGGHNRESLKSLLTGYTFFHEGRRGKRGEGWAYL